MNNLIIKHVDKYGSHNCGCDVCNSCAIIFTDYAVDSDGNKYFSTSLYQSNRKVGDVVSGDDDWDLY